MITKECLDTVLPIVADSWDQLRGCDVDRLLDQFHYEHVDSLNEAGNIIAKQRPDLHERVAAAVEVIKDDRGWNDPRP